ncbi:MAG: pilus assembly protein PilM [Phycisphaerales bacterium]|nr:pilus assembly protein PilM [Phycisphaerales bacterium]
MELMPGTSALPIGVDIGQRHIKAVQLKGSPGRWSISAAGAILRENPDAQADRTDALQLRNLLATGGFKGRKIILAVPGKHLLTGIMELPPRNSGAPLGQLARNELSRLHRCEPDSFEMACWDLPDPARAGGLTYVMAAGCEHQYANSLVDTIESEGLEVAALDIRASAISRACGPMLDGVSGIVAVLDLGWSRAHLVLLHQDVIVYERKLTKCGIGAVVESLSRELKLHRQRAEALLMETGLSSPASNVGSEQRQGVSSASETYCRTLVEEMRIPLSYLGNQYPDALPETLLIVGSAATIPGVEKQLDSLLDFHVRTVRPGDVVTCTSDIDERFGPSIIAAAGLGQFSVRATSEQL